MKRPPDTYKDVRLVIRIEKKQADWLSGAAQRADCSVGRIVRMAIRKLRYLEENGEVTFENPAPQLLTGFAE